MSKKKRQNLTMLLLLLLFFAVLGAYYGIDRYQSAQEKAEEDEEAEEISMYDVDSDSLVAIAYKNDKADLNFVKKHDTWMLAGDEQFPIDQTRLEDMADAIGNLTAERIVNKECSDLSDYNLDNPDLEIIATDEDEEQIHLVVGEESMSGGGRYAYLKEDAGTVYLISTAVYSSYDYSMSQLMELASMPTFKAENVTGLLVDSKKRDDFHVVYDGKNSPYKDIYGWAIEAPYSQPVAADQDQLQSLFEGYSDLALSEGITYKTDDDTLKKYGLSNPQYTITVDYTKKKKAKMLKLCVGDETEDGSGYYVTVSTVDGIYVLPADTVSQMTDISPLDYVYQRLYTGEEEKLDELTFSYNGRKATFAVTKKKEESSEDEEEAEEEYTYTIKKDGEEVDSDDFLEAFAKLCYLPPNGNIDPSLKVRGEDVVAAFAMKEGKKTTTVNFYPYDGKNFYRIEVDGVMQFVVNKKDIDSILESFADLD